ncbi:carbohydrate ABC transporter permease [Bacillus timonensis]|uniref:carbohydrate ABC transporter permease n=1 Tax=Bacillus timonensis TaxID=1033734 RepID=UPI000287BE16|nr:carbohydrate ABC transporter permease [Bacillus timonensis]
MTFIKKSVLYFITIFVGFAFVFPFIWVLLTSLKTDDDIYQQPIKILPEQFTLEQYTSIFTKSPELLTFFWNSTLITIISVALVTIFSGMAGYVIARYKFVGSKSFFFLLLLVMFVPWVIFLIPIYILEDTLNLVNTRVGLILPYIALNLPLGIFIMRGNFNLIPKEIEDAALVDGCNVFQMWYKIMLPMVRPGLATVIILTGISVWEEFMYARSLITSQEAWTVPVGITMLQQEAQAWAFGTLSAAILLSLIPLLILFLAFQKYFIKGITDGSVKG